MAMDLQARLKVLMAEDQTYPKLIGDVVPKWIPAAVLVFSIVAFGVRADARINQHDVEIQRYATVMNQATDRMARMEEQLKAQGKILERIEGKIDAR